MFSSWGGLKIAKPRDALASVLCQPSELKSRLEQPHVRKRAKNGQTPDEVNICHVCYNLTVATYETDYCGIHFLIESDGSVIVDGRKHKPSIRRGAGFIIIRHDSFFKKNYFCCVIY